MKTLFLSLLITAAATSHAGLSIAGIANFDHDATDSFDSAPAGPTGLISTAFGAVSDSAGLLSVDASAPLLGKGGSVSAVGAQLVGAASQSAPHTTTFTFSEPIDRFGGLFQSDGDDLGFGVTTQPITFRFYTASNEFTDVLISPNDGLTLDYFAFLATDEPLVRVDIVDNSAGQYGYAFDDIEVTFAPVPEPASMAVLGLGLAALKRRRRA